MNIGVHVSLSILFSLVCCAAVGLLGDMAVLFPVFKGISTLFSIVAVLVCIPTNTWVSLFFNMLSRFVTAFLPRSKSYLISWLQSLSSVILEPMKIKSANDFSFLPCICQEMMGLGCTIFVFWMLSYKPAFSLSSFIFIKRLFSFSSLLSLEWNHLYIWGCWYFLWKLWCQLVIHSAKHFAWCTLHRGLRWWLSSKESACSAGATGNADSIPGLGRSPGEGHGNPPQWILLPGESHGQRNLLGYRP